jgi:hypothetical protein
MLSGCYCDVGNVRNYSAESRNSFGGTAKARVLEQIGIVRDRYGDTS